MTWIRDKWDHSGCTNAIDVGEQLASVQSTFQSIEVYESNLGKVLLLDGIIHVCESDEYCYHEMIVHPALHVHAAIKKVLVIGGGDGGTVRELLKHPVDSIDVCEIDSEVISICKEHFPKLSKSFNDSRVNIHIADGNEFLDTHSGYDLIIVDSSDPVGPAKVLFGDIFYSKLHKALHDDGIAITQSEGMFFDKETLKSVQESGRKCFSTVRYYYTLVPTYPSGTIGFSFCSKKYDPLQNRENEIDGLKYYSTDIHASAFTIPPFLKQELK